MKENEIKTVRLIASGYDWDCPHCGHANESEEATEFVTCAYCGEESQVVETFHKC